MMLRTCASCRAHAGRPIGRASSTSAGSARDQVLFGHTSLLRVALVRATASAEEARARGGLRDARATALLSKAVAAAALLSAFQEGEERSILQFSDGAEGAPLAHVYAEALHLGEVRA
jgi:redox-regulated HSP33 family molecular chaperone